MQAPEMPGRTDAREQDTWQNSITAAVSKGMSGDPPSLPFPPLPTLFTLQDRLHLLCAFPRVTSTTVGWHCGRQAMPGGAGDKRSLVHDDNHGHIALHNALDALHHAAAAAATGCDCSPDNLSLMRQPLHMNVSGSLPELLWLATVSMTFPALAALAYCFGKLHAARNGLLLGCLLPLLFRLGKLCGPHMAHQGLH